LPIEDDPAKTHSHSGRSQKNCQSKNEDYFPAPGYAHTAILARQN